MRITLLFLMGVLQAVFITAWVCQTIPPPVWRLMLGSVAAACSGVALGSWWIATRRRR